LTDLENKFLEIANELLGEEIGNQKGKHDSDDHGGNDLMDKILSAREEVKETKHSL
jgi:hypothetical protein